MYTECREYRLKGNFIYKRIQGRDSNNRYHLGKSVVTAHLAVEIFPPQEFQIIKYFPKAHYSLEH